MDYCPICGEFTVLESNGFCPDCNFDLMERRCLEEAYEMPVCNPEAF